MARRKKNEETTTTRPREKGNFLSDKALTALESGTYGQKYGRDMQYRTSQEQTQQVQNLPVLEGMLGSQYSTPEWESRFSKARQYQQNLEDEANKYTWNAQTRANNTLDKKDSAYLQRLVDNFGDGDLTYSTMMESGRTKDWEQKYGKSLDQIYKDFIADQGNIKMERGKAHPILGEIANLAGNLPVALSSLPSLVSNAVAPESDFAKKTEEARHKAEENRRYIKAGIKERTGDKGDKILDTINEVGERMIPTLVGNAVGGNALGGVFAGLSEANKKMEDLRIRPMTDQERAKSALGYGTVEGLGTGITTGLLDWLPKASGALGVARNIVAGTGGGAAENAIQEKVEQALDQVINGENSERELNKAVYMLQGMDEISAAQKADEDLSGRVRQSALTGALFGGGMKALGEIGNAIKGRVPSLDVEETKAKTPVEETKLQEAEPIVEETKQTKKGAKKAQEIPKLEEVDDMIEDIEPEVNTRAYTPDEMTEINDFIAQRDAIRAEMDKNVDLFNPDKMARHQELSKQLKGLNAEIAKKYPELFNTLGHFRGLPETDDVAPKAPVETPDTDEIMSRNVGKKRPFIENTPEGDKAESALDAERMGLPLTEEEQAALDNVTSNQRTRGNTNVANNVPPVVPEEIPEPVQGGDKIRSFSKRGAADETLPDEIRETLSEDFYDVVHNADTEAKAKSLFNADNLIQTRSNLDRAVASHDPAAASLSYKLAKAYIDNGEYDAATDVLEKVSAELTRMGQFTQAAKLAMLQNDPLAALRSYMRDLEKLNEWGKEKYKGKWNNLELTEDDIKTFNQIPKGDKEALNEFIDQLNDRFGSQIPANLWEKVVAATKTSMLLNMRTQGRNVIANAAMLPVRSASDRVAALGQNIAHLINPNVKVTQSLTGGTKAQKAIAGQLFEQIKDSILGENKMKDSVKSDILSKRRIFNDDALGRFIDNHTNGGLQKLNERLGGNANKSMMETLQNFTYWLMGDFGDTPFVKQNFVNRLASYMKAQGINNIDDIPDEAKNIAIEEALKATFKDDNAFTKALTGTKQKWGKFGEIALPFVKTPANLAMRAVDYSPAGLINTFKKIKSGADASKVIDDLSKNLTGTAMIYLGYKLRENGLLSGNYSNDADEKAWQKQHGMLENAIHVGDTYYTIDWAQPTVTPMILGSVMYDAFKDSDDENAGILDAINSTYKGGLAVANSWLSTSPLQSLTDILGGNSYGDGGIAENIANEIIEFPQRFVPAQLGAAARTIDPVIRDTYTKDDSLTGVLGNQMTATMSKIPGLSKSLPASYDTWGNERTRSDTKGQAFFAQNLNPGQLGNNNPTPLDAEIQRIYDATGNNGVFPLNAARSLDLGSDGKINLTNEQHSLYQKTMGKRSYAYAESLMKNPEFNNLSDDEKADVLSKAYGLSNDLTKEELFNHTTDNNKNLKEVARTGNTNAVAQYLIDSVMAKNIGLNVESYRKKNSELPGGVQQWAEDKQAALDAGFIQKDGSPNLDAYEKAKTIVGDSVPALQFYQDYQAQDFSKMADKIPYVMDNTTLTNAQKGMLVSGKTDPSKLEGKIVNEMYNMAGWEGVYYWYLLKNLADTDGNGSIKKSERDALLNSNDPYVQALSDEIYYYLAGQNW